MRASTIGIAILTLSTAALAQVTRTPVEQKNAPANASMSGNDTSASDMPGNDATTNGATLNDTDAKTEPATPRR